MVFNYQRNWIIQRLAGPGKFTVFDFVNYFESFELTEESRPYTHFESLLGGVIMLVATYGHKGIMGPAQRYSMKIMSVGYNGFAFVDDGIDKLPPNPTYQEFKEEHVTLFQSIKDSGQIINPGKCYFNVEEIDYCGMYISQTKNGATEKYKQKMLKLERPLNAEFCKSTTAAIRFLTRQFQN